MAGIIQEKNLAKIGKEPVVIFPLKQWEKIEKDIEDLRDAIKFKVAYGETRGQKLFTLKELKKNYNLK